MPTFDSIEAIKKEVLKRMKTALEYAEDDVRTVLAEYTDRFYDEYDPVKYQRTYQLYDSIHDTFGTSNVKPIGDIGVSTIVGYNGNWNYREEPDDRGWTTEEIVHANMYGHPQHNYGDPPMTATWRTPMEILRDNGGAYDILKESLNKAGLSIK